jgi:hypothetical protein
VARAACPVGKRAPAALRYLLALTCRDVLPTVTALTREQSHFGFQFRITVIGEVSSSSMSALIRKRWPSDDTAY